MLCFNAHGLEECCSVQVFLFEIDCAIFYTNLHALFCQFISWTNWVNSGKFMDNCWISCQVMADMEKFYDDLIIINLYFSCHPILEQSQILIDNNVWQLLGSSGSYQVAIGKSGRIWIFINHKFLLKFSFYTFILFT